MADRTANGGFPATLMVWASFVIAVFLCTIAFGDGLVELVRRWSTQDEYNHGFLIPVISMWLLWQRRTALLGSLGPPHWTGALIVLVSIAMLIVGELTAIFLLLQLGFLVALTGTVVAIGGFSLLRVATLPIAFLAFAIPLPYFVDAMLSWRLQLISSELGVLFLTLFAVPVYLEGNMIDLGVYKIQVVEACSGLRYLYPFLSLGFLAAYLFQAPLWQRWLVVLSTIPITIGMNSARIGMIGILVKHWGPGAAEGFLHTFEGWVIFLVCALILWLEVWTLARLNGRGFFETWGVPPRLSYTAVRSYLPRINRTSLIAVGGLIVAIPAVILLGGREEIVPERDRFVSFPRSLGDWKGEISYLEPQIEHALGLTDYVLADYRNGKTPPINLYIAYYDSQRKGVSPHSPSVCIPGGGWLITDLKRVDITLDGSSTKTPVNRVVISRNSYQQLVYYWFDQRGRKIANEWSLKGYLLADALFQNRTDGALVRLTTPVRDDEDIAAADTRIVSMMKNLASVTPRYLPQ